MEKDTDLQWALGCHLSQVHGGTWSSAGYRDTWGCQSGNGWGGSKVEMQAYTQHQYEERAVGACAVAPWLGKVWGAWWQPMPWGL